MRSSSEHGVGAGAVILEAPEVPVDRDMELGVVLLRKAIGVRIAGALNVVPTHLPDWHACDGVIRVDGKGEVVMIS